VDTVFDALTLALSIAIAAPQRAADDVSQTQSFTLATRAEPRPIAAQRVFLALNATRVAAGLAPLQEDPELSTVALEHADDMIARRYFGHVAPDGVTPEQRLSAHGYRAMMAGENIAWCGDEHEAEVDLWQSLGHRSNQLDPRFTRVGVAVVRTGSDGDLFVEIYATQ